MQISPGAVIAGRYRADRKIGAGAMGEVWAGENVNVGYKVAIKAMLQAAAMDPEVVARFKREALILSRIRSDFVARVLDFAPDETYGLVLILDLIEGEAFSTTLRRTKLTVEEAVEVGADVVSGLCDLHRANIVHRDLKPGNIILEPRPDGSQRAIIVDFGVSRVMKTQDEDEEITNITRADMALGTLEYMAPEQMLDSRNVTGGSDIYAVGAMLYRAVAGTHAFGDLVDVELARMKLLHETPPLVTGRDDPIAKGYEAVISRALRRRPADRYKRAEEMLADLVALRDKMKQQTAAAAGPAGRRPLRSLIEDEATADTVTRALGIDVEVSASFKADSLAESPSQMPPPSATVKSTAARLTGAASSPSSATPARSSAAPAAPAAEPALDLTPPPRRGVSVGLVVVLVFVALIGGAVLGVMMVTPPAPEAADPSASAQPSPTAAALPPSSTPAVQPSAPEAGVPTDAGLSDASTDASRPDAAAPADASAPPVPIDAAVPRDAAAPFLPPQVSPPRPGGPLPGMPGSGGPTPAMPQKLAP